MAVHYHRPRERYAAALTDLTKLYPIVHHPAWAGWTGAALG